MLGISFLVRRLMGKPTWNYIFPPISIYCLSTDNIRGGLTGVNKLVNISIINSGKKKQYSPEKYTEDCKWSLQEKSFQKH